MIKSKKSSIREGLEKNKDQLENKLNLLISKNKGLTPKVEKNNFNNDYKFYFTPNYIQKIAQKKIDINLDWKYIREIRVRSLEQITCSICLSHNNEILLPRVLKCNHVYCLPCILTHFIDLRMDCPVCGSKICLIELKKIRINSLNIILGDKISFYLMKKNFRRKKISFFQKIIKNNFLNNRDCVSNDKFVNGLMQELETFESDERINDYDDIVKKSTEFYLLKKIETSQNKIDDTLLDKRKRKKAKIENEDKYIFFYQHILGYKVFLDFLDFKFLVVEYKSIDKLPTTLENKLITNIEKMNKKKKNLEFNNYFSHIDQNSIFYILHIDMKSLLSPENYKNYLIQYEKKIKKAKRVKKTEENKKKKNNIFEEDYLLALMLSEELYRNPVKFKDEGIKEQDFVEKYEENYPGLEIEKEKKMSSRLKKLKIFNTKTTDFKKLELMKKKNLKRRSEKINFIEGYEENYPELEFGKKQQFDNRLLKLREINKTINLDLKNKKKMKIVKEEKKCENDNDFIVLIKKKKKKKRKYKK